MPGGLAFDGITVIIVILMLFCCLDLSHVSLSVGNVCLYACVCVCIASNWDLGVRTEYRTWKV